MSTSNIPQTYKPNEQESDSGSISDSSLGSAVSQDELNPVGLNAQSSETENHSKKNDGSGFSVRRSSTTRRRFSAVSRTTTAKSDRSAISAQEHGELEEDLTRQFSIADALLLTDTQRRKSDSESSIHEVPEEDQDDQGELNREPSNVDKIFTNKSTGQLDLPPDGGYGWVCVACVVAIQACTWGANAGFGVFLEFYLNNNVFPGASSYDFAVIAGLIVFCAQFFAPIAMIVMKMVGFKLTMSIASVIHFAGYMLASYATKIWHLYVCQGLIIGICYAFLFVPASITIPSWFLKKRAIASGLCFGGTGLGGVIYSVSVNAMIKRTGDQRWALRMMAISTLFAFVMSIIFIKQRIPFERQKFTFKNFINNTRLMFSARVLKSKPLWYVTLWFAFSIMGYNMVIFSYATYATTMGLSASQGSTLTALINAAQTIGRPMIGLASDRVFGRVNFTLMIDLVLVILVLAFWICAKTFVTLLICGLMIGLSIGVGNVMNPVLIADSFAIEDFASAWSILNMVIGIFSLPTEVIALALRDYSLSNPFLYTQIFAGLLFAVSIIILSPQREYAVAKFMRKRRDQLKRDLRDIEPMGKEVSNVHVEEMTNDLKERIDKYDDLLQENPPAYFKRLFYPMRI